MKNILFRCVTALLLAGSVFAEKKMTRPNLLLIVTDDESWFEHDIYGHSNLKTPHFNRLAEEGVLFTHGYVSAPSCGPSRASILTGRNLWELEQGAFMLSYLPKKFTSMMEILENNGYQPAFTGKRWGPGLYPKEGQSGMAGKGYYDVTIKDYEKRDYLDRYDVPGNFAAFLAERDVEKPFVFWAGINEPHAKWPTQQEAEKLLKDEFNVDAHRINQDPGNNPHIQPFGFYYEILHADRQVGQMLASLEQQGLLENTIVLYIGDNGSDSDPGGVLEEAAMRNGTDLDPLRMKGKNTPYDAGTRVPMALMWKGTVPPGRVIDDFVKSIDIAPTFLQAAGVAVPPFMTGKSFLDMVLSDQSGSIDPERDFVMTGSEWHTHPRTTRTIRDKRYEYIVKYPNANRSEQIVELYDLQNDMWEYNNLIDNPEYASVKERLKTRMDEYGRKTGDPRTTGDLELFNETLKVQDLLLPHWNKGMEIRRWVSGKPYGDLKKYLGFE
ncbi:sulfatase family protein [Tichowtungia aerotolerans]|uniref:Sulfatase-like hydrolase/transferase n=1 Tax=Tichowtungia aerotolerans TaxID=2697043 RepID=A0A6P1MA42_9BACT|nr:sulfatase [Tichowtungia aerotolerans]QHI67995.1 sulfatase-like hydrolase/transferase [Tichowtungia aerotolerans]